jgi:uncharacterized iron-regulated protein
VIARLASGLASGLACVALMVGSGATAGDIGLTDLDRLPPAEVVILGEVHDNPAHHAAQAQALAALNPRAVVWEMLTPDQAARLPADLSDPDRVAAAVGWAESGWPDFALYHPLMLATPGALHLGAGVPRDRARRVFGEPLEQVFGPLAARFGLDGDLPTSEQTAREAEMQAAHCDALPEDLLPGMVAAQRLRDGELARVALAALADTGPPVAIITGNGHARTDWGVPSLIVRMNPGARVLSVGMLEAPPGAPPPYDLWLVTDPAPRDDPCAAFR